jgi:hypothetical protein
VETVARIVVGWGADMVLSAMGAWVSGVGITLVEDGSSTTVGEFVAAGSTTCWAGGLAQADTPSDIAIDHSKMMVLALKCYTPSVVASSLSFVYENANSTSVPIYIVPGELLIAHAH